MKTMYMTGQNGSKTDIFNGQIDILTRHCLWASSYIELWISNLMFEKLKVQLFWLNLFIIYS